MKEKRIRINKKMVAWSNGECTNIIPSIFHQVDDYGRAMRNCLNNYREGDEYYYGPCAMVRDECRCLEYEADRAWERGHHLEALNQMFYAATMVLPDESVGFEFEDMQWLNPNENLYWHPNLKEFRRLMRRCRELCKREPRLWPVLEGDWLYRKYLKYLDDLGRWARPAPASKEVYRNCW